MSTRQVDCIIIGSGQGGTALASSLAGQGRHVTLFERHRLGGSCVNYGCTPSKAMLAPAHAIGQARWAQTLGVAMSARPDFARIMQRVRAVRDQWREGVNSIRDVEHLEVIMTEARFDDAGTVRGGDEVRTAERIVINTGTSPNIPPIDGLVGAPYLTNETIFELTELPKRTCVLGGGYIGLELGQALARFGSSVTIVDHHDRIMSKETRHVSHTLQKALRDDGIAFRFGARMSSVSHDGKRFTIGFDDDGESLEADALLVAAGRHPNTAALNLDAAGIETDDQGFVRINDVYETTADGVYAIGDCAGQPAFTHVSSEDGRRLQAIWDPGGSDPQRTRHDRVLAYAMFTDPSLGRVGMDEQQAASAGHDPAVHRTPLADTARGREWNLTCGYFEIVADKSTGRLLGATFIGQDASEMVQLFLPLVQQKMTVEAVAESVFVHPTFGESIMMLARKFNSA